MQCCWKTSCSLGKCVRSSCKPSKRNMNLDIPVSGAKQSPAIPPETCVRGSAGNAVPENNKAAILYGMFLVTEAMKSQLPVVQIHTKADIKHVSGALSIFYAYFSVYQWAIGEIKRSVTRVCFSRKSAPALSLSAPVVFKKRRLMSQEPITLNEALH